MARSYQRDNFWVDCKAHHNGSMIKGLLIWLVLGGASFFIGFVLLARLIPTSKLPENTKPDSSETHTPAQTAQITSPAETQTSPIVTLRSPISAVSKNPTDRKTAIPMPSIDPAEKPASADPSVQKPDNLDGNSEQANRDSNDENTGRSRSEILLPSVDSTTAASPVKKHKRRSHRKIKQEAVQSPASIDNSSEPIPAAPSIEPGGDPEVPPTKEN